MDLLVPTVFGAELNSITINPNLPAGLYFVGSRGTIAGAPTVKDLAGTEYTITVSNAAGNYSTTLNITIIALTCPAVDGWQEDGYRRPRLQELRRHDGRNELP